MSIEGISSPSAKRALPEPQTPSPKRVAVAEQILKTPSPLRGAFKLTPGRVIRPGTPSKKHYIKVLGTEKSREHRKICQNLKNRLMHTFASPNASPRSTKRKFPETVVVGKDGHITSPGGTKYSAHREPGSDGEHVIYPIEGPRTFRCSGKYALEIVKRLRKDPVKGQTQVLQDLEAAIAAKKS